MYATSMNARNAQQHTIERQVGTSSPGTKNMPRKDSRIVGHPTSPTSHLTEVQGPTGWDGRCSRRYSPPTE